MIVDEYLTHLNIQGKGEDYSIQLSEIINAINFTYTNYTLSLERLAKNCLDLADREKSVCMIKAKIHAKNEQLNNLNKLKTINRSNRIITKIKEVIDELSMFNKQLNREE